MSHRLFIIKMEQVDFRVILKVPVVSIEILFEVMNLWVEFYIMLSSDVMICNIDSHQHVILVSATCLCCADVDELLGEYMFQLQHNSIDYCFYSDLIPVNIT